MIFFYDGVHVKHLKYVLRSPNRYAIIPLEEEQLSVRVVLTQAAFMEYFAFICPNLLSNLESSYHLEKPYTFQPWQSHFPVEATTRKSQLY